MRMQETPFDGAIPVEGYGPGFFRVGGQIYRGALLMRGSEISTWAGLDDPAPLLALAGQVDVLLLGMGETLRYAPASFREALEEAGIGVEVMASPTACRSYNVLASEGRRVALAALPV